MGKALIFLVDHLKKYCFNSYSSTRAMAIWPNTIRFYFTIYKCTDRNIEMTCNLEKKNLN